MFRVLFPSENGNLCTSPPPRELLRPLSEGDAPHPHDLQLWGSPLASPFWRRELGPRVQSKGSGSPSLAVSQVFFHSTFLGRRRPPHPPQPFSPPWPRIGGRYPGNIAHGPCLHTGRGRGGRRRRGGVDGRHKEGHKAETTVATAYPTAISASSMKPRTMADRRNR